MESKQLLGIIGAILLIAGLFMPLVKISLVGDIGFSVNFYKYNQDVAIVIIALCVISIVFILVKRYSLLWFSSIAIIALMSVPGVQIAKRILKVKSKTESVADKLNIENFTDKMMDKITNATIDHVRIQWGLAILSGGLLLIILCAIIGSRKKRAPAVAKQKQIT